MARIIAGQGKGRRLKAPKGLDTRPTGARVRQSLLDILAPRLPGSRFLDLCAGSGGVGLEALSRGAAGVVFVDQSAAAIQTVRANLETLGQTGGEAQVFRQDAQTALRGFARGGRRFDLIYLDPPYDSALYEPLLTAVSDLGVLEGDGVLVAEHFHKRALPETIGRLVLFRAVRVGDHVLSFYRFRQEETG